MLAAGGLGLADAYGVHPYPSPSDLAPGSAGGPAAHRFLGLQAMIDVLAIFGQPKAPLWISEIGWSVHETRSAPWLRGVDVTEQADYLGQAVDIVRSYFPTVRGITWYTARDREVGNTHERSFGLFDRDLEARPAAAALLEASTRIRRDERRRTPRVPIINFRSVAS